ncbi:MAG: hypothetical protein DMF87_21595 [Acidobacteria bacterium]|nr:MAG: hypothetical protein DMF87_21595 [Acidobacteriota bacterium]
MIRIGDRRFRRPRLRRSTIDAERRRLLLTQAVNRVGVVVVVADAAAFRVDHPDRALEQRGLGKSLRDRALEDVETVLVHRDVAEGARLVGIGKLHEQAFDDLLELQVHVGGLHAGPLNHLQRGEGHRAADVHLRVAEADDAAALAVLRADAGLRARRALLRALLTELQHRAIVDDGDRVLFLAVVRAEQLRGQVVAVLRDPGDVLDLRLAGKVHLEAVLWELEVVPVFLRHHGRCQGQNESRRQPSKHAHSSSGKAVEPMEYRNISGPMDTVETCLARIAGINPRLNAFITVLADEARERARRADETTKTF